MKNDAPGDWPPEHDIPQDALYVFRPDYWLHATAVPHGADLSRYLIFRQIEAKRSVYTAQDINDILAAPETERSLKTRFLALIPLFPDRQRRLLAETLESGSLQAIRDINPELAQCIEAWQEEYQVHRASTHAYMIPFTQEYRAPGKINRHR